MLENTVLHVHYSGDYIWSFIPTDCRYCWIHHPKSKFWDIFSRISIKNTKPFLNDTTMNLNDLKKGIKSGKLQELSQVCNYYILPKIMRPWGDSAFTHRCGYIYIDIIIQRYLQHCEIKLIDNNNLKK